MNLEELKAKLIPYRDKFNAYHFAHRPFGHPALQVLHVIAPSLGMCALSNLLFGKVFAMLFALILIFYWFYQMKDSDMNDSYRQQNGILLFLFLSAYIFRGISPFATLFFFLIILPFVSYLILAKNPPAFLMRLRFESFQSLLDKQIYKTGALEENVKKSITPALFLLYAVSFNLPLLLM